MGRLSWTHSTAVSLPLRHYGQLEREDRGQSGRTPSCSLWEEFVSPELVATHPWIVPKSDTYDFRRGIISGALKLLSARLQHKASEQDSWGFKSRLPH